MSDIAIVTGGASGIGAALSSALVRRGAHVVLADIDEYGAAQLASWLTDRGPGSAEAAHVDVRNASDVAELVHETHHRHGRLDLMFNNAGIAVGGEPEELLLDHWDRVIDVNLRGVIHGCHVAYPLMKAQGSGHIVNTASVAGLMPVPGWMTPYATTKHAVVGLSLGLRAAGADYGVRVSVLCPGVTETPILDSNGPPDLPEPPSLAGTRGSRDEWEALKIKPYPVDRLAADALQGIARNKPIIVAPMSARVQWQLWRTAPWFVVRWAASSTRKSRARRQTTEPVT